MKEEQMTSMVKKTTSNSSWQFFSLIGVKHWLYLFIHASCLWKMYCTGSMSKPKRHVHSNSKIAAVCVKHNQLINK